ncbi:TerD family protein [Streptomyces sp. AM 3-1-1]|uniref:TerD family protein n=1 Tax=Streptomyces sp. AM 3-1-1 TaxID=3028711 RepID=UPI0023B8BB70|nr:TerD family protein [Streptomyces sp. AM 3-1-1]WEH29714.1 TerD family protein [Streptomyces sp. AM 3-1-1]
MSREFQRGHKARISDLTAGTDLYIGVRIGGPGLTFDISCFGLDAEETLSDDRYFIFFNQPKSPEESLQLLGPQAGDTESFRVTLDRVPERIRKLSFTATIDGAGQMSQAGPGYLRIVAGGEEVARYSFTGSEFSTERAVMVGDLYYKDGWRFAAVGQGFDGGLEALLRNFGGEVLEEEEAPAEVPAQQQAPGFAPPPFAPPTSAEPEPQAQPPHQAPPQARPQPTAPQSYAAPVAPPAPAPAPAPFAPPAPQPPAPQPPDVHAAPTVVAPFSPPPAAPAPPAQPGPPPGYPAPPAQPTAPPPPTADGYHAPPFGAAPPAPGAPGFPPGPGAPRPIPDGNSPKGVAVNLEKYREVPTGRRWTQQNDKLVRVDLGEDGSPVLARQGSMVLYQGKVDFSYKGAGFKGRIVGNATGQELQLMRCTGKGQVFLAEDEAHLHPIELQGDAICVSAESVLAFDESLQREVRRIDGHGLPGGSLFTMQFQGTGTVIVKTHGTPVVLPVTPTTFADANAVVAWSAASQVVLSSQVRLRRNAYPGHSGESVNLQFRGAPGNFIVVQPYEI